MKAVRALLAFLLSLGTLTTSFAQSDESGPSNDAAVPGRPGREVSLPPNEVRDTFFAYVLGIVMQGLEVDIGNAEMRDILTEFKSTLDVPFDLITRVIQHNDGETGARTISLLFNGAVVIPIPFSLLGYHPGTVRSTERVSFRVQRFLHTDPKNPKGTTWVWDLVLSDGNVLIDLDDWIAYLFGNIFDKIQVRHIVFFSYQNDWIGLLEGKGKVWGRDMREYFNFTHNGIIFPIPPRLDALGAELMSSTSYATAAAR